MDRNDLDYDPGPVGQSYSRLGPPLPKADENVALTHAPLTSSTLPIQHAQERKPLVRPEIWTNEL